MSDKTKKTDMKAKYSEMWGQHILLSPVSYDQTIDQAIKETIKAIGLAEFCGYPALALHLNTIKQELERSRMHLWKGEVTE